MEFWRVNNNILAIVYFCGDLNGVRSLQTFCFYTTVNFKLHNVSSLILFKKKINEEVTNFCGNVQRAKGKSTIASNGLIQPAICPYISHWPFQPFVYKNDCAPEE